MTKFKVIKDKDSFAIYKCWLWTIQDENGFWIGKTYKNSPPYFASKQKAEEFLQELSK
jgi:hypothetical protein